MSVIDWNHDGRQPLIEARILQPQPSIDVFGVSVVALVDTGSTASGVTHELANKLRLKGIGKRPLVSARSDDQVERFVFRVGLDMPENEPQGMPFVFDGVLGFELRTGFKFEALIGMDILRQCDLTMRRDRSCRLEFGY